MHRSLLGPAKSVRAEAESGTGVPGNATVLACDAQRRSSPWRAQAAARKPARRAEHGTVGATRPWVRITVVAPVVTEACFHLPHSSQRERLRRFLSAFSVATYVSDDEPTLWQEVFEWLDRYSEYEPDWADGYLAVVSAREPKSRVWTYDREFKTTWRRPAGSRIPLASSR